MPARVLGFPQPSAPELEELRRRLHRAVTAACPSWLRDSADDVVQAAMLKVLRLAEGEGAGLPPASYLWRVAHSAVVDEIRRRRRRREDPLEGEDVIDRTASPAPDPERHAAGRRLGEAIAACLRRLVEARRQAVALYLLGHRVPEIAGLAGWSPKRAENLVYRGLDDLRRCLRAKGLEP